MTLKSMFRIGVLLGAFFVSVAALAQSFEGEICPGCVMGNPSAAQRTPTNAPLSAVMDRALCGVQSSNPVRGPNGWQCGIRAGVWANDFSGSDCDGVTPTQVAFQNAINLAQSLGMPMRFQGQCYIAATLNITAQLDFGGQGSHASSGANASILIGAPAIDIIHITTGAGANPVYLHDFAIDYSSSALAGTNAIVVGGTAGNENKNSKFERISISYGTGLAYNGITFNQASTWSIFETTVAFQYNGVVIQNTNNVDSGDSQIIGSWFDGGNGANAAIEFFSSGGLRFIGNKTNGTAMGNGLQVVLGSGVFTSDLFIVGNSFEGIASTGSALSFTRFGSTGNFGLITISANELTGKWCVFVPTDGAGGTWLNDVSITGNVCLLNNTSGAAGFAIDSTNNFNISGNVVQSQNSNSQKVAIGTAATNGYINAPSGVGPFVASTYGASATNIVHDPYGLVLSAMPSTIGNGSQIFVTDGAPASSPCTGTSTGSMAFRQNGAWKCF